MEDTFEVTDVFDFLEKYAIIQVIEETADEWEYENPNNVSFHAVGGENSDVFTHRSTYGIVPVTVLAFIYFFQTSASLKSVKSLNAL